MHLVNISLALFTVQLLFQIDVLNAFTVPCNASVMTVTRVEMCPTNMSAYEEAAEKKNCTKMVSEAQTCKSFEYHCVLNDDLNYAVEVCAPSLLIIGNVCAMFSRVRRGIIRIDGDVCKKCPYHYNSTFASFYTECYTNLNEYFTKEIPKSFSSEGVTTSTGPIKTITFNSQAETSVFIPILSTTVAVLLLILILIFINYLRQRNKNGMPQADLQLVESRSRNFNNSITLTDISEETQIPLLVQSDEGIVKNKIYTDRGASFRFVKLCNDLDNDFSIEKLEKLKDLIILFGNVNDVESLRAAKSIRECFLLLQKENLFSQKDVIFMQFLFEKTDDEDLSLKCTKYAKEQTALCYFREPPENGFTEVQFHIKVDLTSYTKEDIDDIVVTVAAILECNQYDIRVNGIKHSKSFMLLLSIKETYSCKLPFLSRQDCMTLVKLDIDYIVLDQNKIILEKPQETLEGKSFHINDETFTQYKVHQCSKCPGDKEFYCVSCPCHLCHWCKENHVKDLTTIDHTVVTFHDELNYIPTLELCVTHPSESYRKYCESCKIPVCYNCREHKNHKTLDVRTAFETKRQQHRGTIHTIRSEALFYRPVFLTQIKADFKTCHTEFPLYQSEMSAKAQELKDLIDKVKKDFMYNVFCDFNFKHRCLKQKVKMKRYIVSLQRYVERYEQQTFTFSALEFLSFIKTARLLQRHLTVHTSQLSMTESVNKEDVMKSLSAIQITERGNRRLGNRRLLKLMSVPEFHQSLTVTGVGGCYQISCVTSDRAWFSDDKNDLILTNTKGISLQRVDDLCSGEYGLHTVNSEGDLIYISKKFNINKLLKDMKTTTTLIKKTDSSWEPRCVCWCPSNGDILVGMYREYTLTGKITRYNQSGQLTQTIQHHNKGWRLYRQPRYVTENNNRDIVVSDNAVVVTDREGRHRFSYTGHPSRSGLAPRGICTDALSHILVCDDRTCTVQIIDKDGQFLYYLLKKSSVILYPQSLSYDVKTHRVWVGSQDNNVVIYNYIQRQKAVTDLIPTTADVMESLSEITTTLKEKTHQGNQCLPNLMSPLKLHTSITETDQFHSIDYEEDSFNKIQITKLEPPYTNVNHLLKMMLLCPAILQYLIETNVYGFNHMSCVTSDLVWVRDDQTNLILINTTGDTLYCLEDFCSNPFSGSHSVNNESELIYIDRNYDIKRLSKDIKTTTTFIERTDLTWKPRCVYCSQSTGELLVGMHREDMKSGKVTRFNSSGKLIQTIQRDNTGHEQYSRPHYITENNNLDIVVSDFSSYIEFGVVVVTDREGRRRFTYTGPPLQSQLKPWGICTDALSHILVCDGVTNTIQMINKDGMFLSCIIKNTEIRTPQSLIYDVTTNRLWVGSRGDNKIYVYRYLRLQDHADDTDHGMKSLSKVQEKEIKEIQLQDHADDTDNGMKSLGKVQEKEMKRNSTQEFWTFQNNI